MSTCTYMYIQIIVCIVFIHALIHMAVYENTDLVHAGIHLCACVYTNQTHSNFIVGQRVGPTKQPHILVYCYVIHPLWMNCIA